MSFWQAIDVAVFRRINSGLSHPFLDGVMPFFAWNRLFVPTLLVLGAVMLWKGGARGRCVVLLAALIIPLGDMCVVNELKQVVGRLRPFQGLADVHLLVGRGSSASMPSSHASSWFAATLLGYVYYRRSLWVLLPLAAVIGFSRIYVGVHYPSDVAAGAIVGMGYAAAGLVAANALWRRVGSAWFPGWWRRMPSLLEPVVREDAAPTAPGVDKESRISDLIFPKSGESQISNFKSEIDGGCGTQPASQSSTLHAPRSTLPPLSTLNPQLSTHREWLRLGYVAIAAMLLGQLWYLASGQIDLSRDEAYQWVWSKHLALSYYSKPPLIAYVQFLGTWLWGDTEFGVRFFSPVFGAALSVLLLRFIAREANARAAFWLVLMAMTTPLLGVGSTLMTVDPLLVLFWNAAMVAGWRAVQPAGTLRQWLAVGLFMGLGLLGKYTALMQLACWGLFFACWPPARAHLRRPGPYLALAVVGVCALPMVVWNMGHHWVTVEHVALQNAGLGAPWRPTLRYFWDFLFSEAALLNPVFFGAMLWAMAAFWRRKDALTLYCFCMGAPVFLGYLLFTLHSRVMPNWIAAAVLPLFCLTVLYWDRRWREGARAVKGWLVAGVVLGGVAVAVLHNTDVVEKIAGRPLPPAWDPLRRVRAWGEAARVVEAARQQLRAEGKEVFLIGDHYSIVGLMSFYVPAAKAAVGQVPLAYFRTSDHPANQFFYWPGYREQRRGQNAIFILEVEAPEPLPAVIAGEFESVRNLGVYPILYRERVFRKIQLFACRNLR